MDHMDPYWIVHLNGSSRASDQLHGNSMLLLAGSAQLEADAKLKVHACPPFGANLPLCAWFAAAGHCLQMFHSLLVLVYGSLASIVELSQSGNQFVRTPVILLGG